MQPNWDQNTKYTGTAYCLPGCMGKNEGKSQNSGGKGLQPDHSYNPNTLKHTKVN